MVDFGMFDGKFVIFGMGFLVCFHNYHFFDPRIVREIWLLWLILSWNLQSGHGVSFWVIFGPFWVLFCHFSIFEHSGLNRYGSISLFWWFSCFFVFFRRVEISGLTFVISFGSFPAEYGQAFGWSWRRWWNPSKNPSRRYSRYKWTPFFIPPLIRPIPGPGMPKMVHFGSFLPFLSILSHFPE